MYNTISTEIACYCKLAAFASFCIHCWQKAREQDRGPSSWTQRKNRRALQSVKRRLYAAETLSHSIWFSTLTIFIFALGILLFGDVYCFANSLLACQIYFAMIFSVRGRDFFLRRWRRERRYEYDSAFYLDPERDVFPSCILLPARSYTDFCLLCLSGFRLKANTTRRVPNKLVFALTSLSLGRSSRKIEAYGHN